jgi:hypothetical protein
MISIYFSSFLRYSNLIQFAEFCKYAEFHFAYTMNTWSCICRIWRKNRVSFRMLCKHAQCKSLWRFAKFVHSKRRVSLSVRILHRGGLHKCGSLKNSVRVLNNDHEKKLKRRARKEKMQIHTLSSLCHTTLESCFRMQSHRAGGKVRVLSRAGPKSVDAMKWWRDAMKHLKLHRR